MNQTKHEVTYSTLFTSQVTKYSGISFSHGFLSQITAIKMMNPPVLLFCSFSLIFTLNRSWIRRTGVQHDGVWVTHCHCTIR